MKRINNLWSQIIDLENIKSAICYAVKHKKHPNRYQRYIKFLDEYAMRIRLILLDNCTDILGKDRVFQFYDARRHKTRTITAPSFYPDQIIHLAILQVIEPVLLRGHYYHSYCGLKTKGTIRAFTRVKSTLKHHPRAKWVLTADIYHCYESIDREILKQLIRKRIKDREVLQWLDVIIDTATGRGLPIGYTTSVRFLELYLEPLDHYIKQHCRVSYYFRYADDLLLIHTNKRQLRTTLQSLQSFLQQYHLQLNHKYQIYNRYSRAIDFVGFRYFSNYVQLRKPTMLALLRTCKRIQNKKHYCVTQARSYMCRLGLLKRCNSRRFYLSHIKPKFSFATARHCISHFDRK